MTEMDTRLTRLAARARRAEEAAKDARAARDETIAEAEESGWTLSRIAALTDLSVAQVGRVAIAQTGKQQQAQPFE